MDGTAAACTGEQGRGFVVVAGEVRAPAQMERMTQQDAVLVEQVTSATLSVEGQTKNLEHGLNRFGTAGRQPET